MEKNTNDSTITIKIDYITRDRLNLINELLGHGKIERVAEILLKDAARVVVSNSGADLLQF
jgi:hypothetical protein